MLRFGPDQGPIVIAALPLFEEANRTRALVVTMCRALAERGVASVLPDLPGQGESEAILQDISLSDWKNAFSHAAARHRDRAVHIVSVRSGSLVTSDATASSRWLFSPHHGGALVRDLLRVRQIAGLDAADHDDALPIDAAGEPLAIAGNTISRSMLRDLRDSIADRTTPSRLVRLESDENEADRHVAGSPLWRRAEPGNDPTLAALLAEDIADWIGTCGG